MKPYANHHGNSGVTEYEITENSISIIFKYGNKIYTYSNSVTGKHRVDTMKELAVSGHGLSTYIAQHKKELAFT
ncbi:MAG: hypothetical protein JRE64_00290 [Deltaproteobacteria bacterium]|nr:hypothetical protein [Deltaproteobacteria bacterium]